MHLFVFVQLMSKETPVTGGNDSYVDLDRQVRRCYGPKGYYIVEWKVPGFVVWPVQFTGFLHFLHTASR